MRSCRASQWVRNEGASMLCLKSRIQLKAGVFWFVLVSVTSWIVLRFLDKKSDPRRSSDELNTKLLATEIEFWQSCASIKKKKASQPGSPFLMVRLIVV